MGVCFASAGLQGFGGSAFWEFLVNRMVLRDEARLACGLKGAQHQTRKNGNPKSGTLNTKRTIKCRP